MFEEKLAIWKQKENKVFPTRVLVLQRIPLLAFYWRKKYQM